MEAKRTKRMAKLKRKQIYLDEDSDFALKQLANMTGISEAEHIRRAAKKYPRMEKINRSKGKDPLEELIGMCDKPEDPSDTSVNHDKYLYGKPQ